MTEQNTMSTKNVSAAEFAGWVLFIGVGGCGVLALCYYWFWSQVPWQVNALLFVPGVLELAGLVTKKGQPIGKDLAVKSLGFCGRHLVGTTFVIAALQGAGIGEAYLGGILNSMLSRFGSIATVWDATALLFQAGAIALMTTGLSYAAGKLFKQIAEGTTSPIDTAQVEKLSAKHLEIERFFARAGAQHVLTRYDYDNALKLARLLGVSLTAEDELETKSTQRT